VDKNDPGAMIIPFSGTFESKIFDMNEEEKRSFLKEQNATRYTLFAICFILVPVEIYSFSAQCP